MVWDAADFDNEGRSRVGPRSVLLKKLPETGKTDLEAQNTP
jgi:hypothetical protein